MKKGRKEAELSSADEGSVEGYINYFILKHLIFLTLFCLIIFFLEEVNVKSWSRVVNKTKPPGLTKGVQTISQPYEDSTTLPYDDDETYSTLRQQVNAFCAAAGSNKCWYPLLYSRSNQKVLANGHQQQQPHRQTILQPQFRHQQSLERPQPQFKCITSRCSLHSS